ncbi:MAG: hypothetical protein NT130_03015 [Candidatus Micrarchaeota archaeon]|nr:hypothetical protein [Candidatus Micrarchaeota archaeon]
MKKSICIVCKGEKKGERVEDDIYIETMRKIKNRLHIAANNTLVVCNDCMQKAEEKRRRFERTLMTWGILATLIFVMLILISHSLMSLFLAIIVSIIVALVFMSIAFLSSYFPKVEKHGGKKGRVGSRKEGAEART